jgi:hypothetical protein
MFDPVGSVSISLGSVVLDRPDQSGQYIAKDLAGGWAYIVRDADGDSRCRGQGVCEGGLDLTLRCGFLSAVSHVPDCGQIGILVDTRRAHRMMVQLAMNDPHVVAAIAGRPVSVMTRPEARSLFQVRTAAERVASVALRTREHEELQGAAEAAEAMTDNDAAAVLGSQESGVVDIGTQHPGAMQNWRARQSVRPARPSVNASKIDAGAQEAAPATSTPPDGVRVRRLVPPPIDRARSDLTTAGVLESRRPRSSAVAAWLQELDSHITTVKEDLLYVGA